MKSITQLINEALALNEMAKINGFIDRLMPYKKYEVIVFDEKQKGPSNIPHFHFTIVDASITIKVKLDNALNLDVLGIIGNKTGIAKDLSNVWSVYSKEAKLLKKWLVANHYDETDLTNLRMINIVWKRLNS
jgi:hypothetical protein